MAICVIAITIHHILYISTCDHALYHISCHNMMFAIYTTIYCNRKTAFKAKHHMLHLNLSIALLIGLIVFVSGVETAKDVSPFMMYNNIRNMVLLWCLYNATYCSNLSV